MGRSCTVCRKPEAGEIARLLEEGRSSRSLALEFGVSKAAMLRHVNGHVVVAIVGNRTASSRTQTGHPESSRRQDPLDELVETLRPQASPATPLSSTSTASRSPPRTMHGMRHLARSRGVPTRMSRDQADVHWSQAVPEGREGLPPGRPAR